MPCPFEAKLGFSTKETRREYLRIVAEREDMAEVSQEAIDRLEADLDTSKPLYFWQLYSILGSDPIIEFITAFYTLVWSDDETHDGQRFKAAFANIAPKEQHITAQSAYWIDSFGGGRKYWGGHSRLGYHHWSQHAEPVMNADGAKRWMGHIRYAISSYDFVGKGFNDPRIVPCLVEFLHTKMRSYADEFEWKLDESDFELSGFQYPPKLHEKDGYMVSPKASLHKKKVKIHIDVEGLN